MDYSIIDCETDGLLDNVTKIHCLSVHRFYKEEQEKFSLTDYAEMRKFLQEEKVIVGHNIKRFDVPVFEKVLGIKYTGRAIDSLALSWYLFPERLKHGLEGWGEDLGVPKPVIEDWVNSTIEELVHRCESDVEINLRLFNVQIENLRAIYNDNSEDIDRLVNYLMFKMDCAKEQEDIKWKLDREKAEANLKLFTEDLDKRIEILADIMPTVKKYKMVARPKVLLKKDGSYSVAGQKWVDLLDSLGLPPYHLGTLKVPDKEERANPKSPAQVKDWLFSFGWKPETFDYKKEDDGTIRPIPQINTKDAGICESVKALYEAHPEVEQLEGLGIVKHRLGIMKGFLENVDKDGFLKAEISGLTNTLRFKHSIIVNLPQIPKLYWEETRGCLIAPDDSHVLCGSDMSGLEDNTKRHYMYYYDPEYVKEMMTDDFDAHLDIAMLAGMLTKEQVAEHKLYDATKGKEGKSHKPVRLKAKKVNFAGVYGAGPAKIALTANIPLSEGKILHTTYWKRNWSVKKIAQMALVKTIGTQMWLFNPVSQFWYSLRFDKDRFSTLNQGTGVYCFDSWVRNVRKRGIKNCGQFHDEIVSPVLKGQEEEHKQKLIAAIDETNAQLNLNVKLGISIDFGHRYSDIH